MIFLPILQASKEFKNRSIIKGKRISQSHTVLWNYTLWSNLWPLTVLYPFLITQCPWNSMLEISLLLFVWALLSYSNSKRLDRTVHRKYDTMFGSWRGSKQLANLAILLTGSNYTFKSLKNYFASYYTSSNTGRVLNV